MNDLNGYFVEKQKVKKLHSLICIMVKQAFQEGVELARDENIHKNENLLWEKSEIKKKLQELGNGNT